MLENPYVTMVWWTISRPESVELRRYILNTYEVDPDDIYIRNMGEFLDISDPKWIVRLRMANNEQNLRIYDELEQDPNVRSRI